MKENFTDIKLVRRAVRGNQKAYGQLAHQYQDYLYRTAYLYLKNQEDALDAVQDCILKGFQNIRKLENPEYFKTWLTRILINCAHDILRKQLPAVPMEHAGELEAARPASMEEKWDLYEAIDGLPYKYKTVIILRYFNELQIQEIACAMGIPEGSVKAYLNRAKQELRSYLEEDYVYAK